jgi:thymidylate synthase
VATVIELDDMQAGYLRLVDEVLTRGRRVSPRGQPTIELPHTTLVLSRPSYATPVGVGRGLSLPLASAETTHLTAGISDAGQLVKVAPAFSQFMNGDRLLGAYGPRIYEQVPNVLVALSRDSETRQAGVQIWRPDELEHDESRDVPCTLSLHWEVRDGRLDAFTVMRSNDVFLGVPYDVTMFTRLQLTLAWALGVAVGTYTHTAFSMHIYERDVHTLEHLTAPEVVVESPVPAYGVGRHDSNPGERFAQTSVARWSRARHWAKIAMLDLPTRVYIPESGIWHRDKLRPYWTNGLLCSHCHYVLPRTVEFFYSLGRDNAWKSRCRDCMKVQVVARPSQLSEARFAQRCARYGVTPEWYAEQLVLQNYLCAICRRPPDNGRYRDFVIDHDHVTGFARGLLCSNCNQALGLVEDDVDRLGAAIDYLRKHSD